MIWVLFFAIMGTMLLLFCYAGSALGRRPLHRCYILFLFLAALSVRLLSAALSKGFDSDTACFAFWADRIVQTGPGGFYSPQVFTDYPPGYMYILWLLGGVKELFHLEYYSVPHLLLLKLPSIAADMACAWLLFRETSRKSSRMQAFFLCMAYLFHPAVILNSSVWGQVDSVFTLTIVVMCLCLIRGKMLFAYIAFGVGLLIKPQMLLFSPVLLAGILDWVFLEKFTFRNLFRQLFHFFCAAAGTVLLCLPFGPENVWNQYFSTIASYPYAAVNACNLWGFLGLNWVSQDDTFLGIPYRVYGAAAIVIVVVLVLLFSLRCRRYKEKYPFLGALVILGIFIFSVRMHERYMYPGLLLLLFAYAYRPDRLCFLCYGGFSLMHFLNTAQVLFFYDPAEYDRKSPFILTVSGGVLLCGGLLYHTALRVCKNGGRPPSRSTTPGLLTGTAPAASRAAVSLSRPDWLIMLVFTAVYSCFALYDLGNREAPSSAFHMVQGQSVELDFGQKAPASLWYYTAPSHDRHFSLEGRNSSSEEWTALGEIVLDNVFTWQNLSLDYGMSQLRLTLEDDNTAILEWVFLDRAGSFVIPDHAPSCDNLFDEASLFPTVSFPALESVSAAAELIPVSAGCALSPKPQYYPEAGSFRNSMYFDEIYHGRTAYEFLNGLPSYENTHPPLGKIIISLGIALFGMNPFGWRIMGTVFGIVMVPAVYLFTKKITGRTSLAGLGCLLFTFDFMHFAQTRLATIDVFITFFVILMYYFMYRYSCVSFYDTALRKTWLPLGACGVCMGLGIASKWTGVYAGIGLGLVFFWLLFKRYREYLYAKSSPDGCTGNISHRYIVENFTKNTWLTLCFSTVFFVLIPAAIYLLSYIPFRDYSDRGLIERMFYNQSTMFDYHSTLDVPHAFSSPWYQWPIIMRPIWYYSRIVTRTLTGGLREGISSFGNPAVWWMGIPAFLYMIYLWIRKKDRTAAFLTTGYLAQYLPWFFVTRITFIYHYFPSVVFIVLMITYSLRKSAFLNRQRHRYGYYILIILYGAAALSLFLLFYPVLSGQPVDFVFADKYLRWFKSWVLIAG